MAVKARWIALAIIAVFIVFINPRFEVIYYEFILLCFAAIGWAQSRVGRVGVSRLELVLMFCDLALLTIVCTSPNPIGTDTWPLAMQYRFDNFLYFYVFMAAATLAYSWRTIFAMAAWTTCLWLVGVTAMWLFSTPQPELTEAMKVAFGDNSRLLDMLDPNSLMIELRIQEVIVFAIVAVILAISSRRSRNLLISHASLERERTNLARYFSPNVVEQLSQNDEPLKQVRTQDVAVLFVDIVGFTAFAASREPEEVIATLREFHSRMEREVFRHNGTLDKFLGDGLMATFGSPTAGTQDATNALACAKAMLSAVEAWNIEREAQGLPPIKSSYGLHYGPAVLGDVGVNQLEFAVIGNTVNVASRLETLTRQLGVSVVASEDLVVKARKEVPGEGCADVGFDKAESQAIRGIDQPVDVWTFATAN